MNRLIRTGWLILFATMAFTTFAQSGKIALEDLWLRYAYFPQSPEEFRWMKDDRFYSVLEEGAIVKYGIEKRLPVETLVDIKALKLPKGISAEKVSGYEFSEDENLVLIQVNSEPIYRRSSKETCLVYNRTSKQLNLLEEGKLVSNASFSPDGSKVAYVFENNLYAFDLATGQRMVLTADGAFNQVINGAADWVYEEELEFARAFAWAPDGKRIAYYRFDESQVPEFSMDMYGDLYPQGYKFKYPKAGEKNSVVTIHVYDLDARKVTTVETGPETDQYIARLTWADAATVAMLRLNRLQNQCDLLFADATTGASRVILSEKSDTYVEVSDNKWHFLTTSTDFLWRSEQDGFYHIYRYNREGKMVKALTKGDFEVMDVLGVDEKNDKLFFLSTEDSPLQRQVYSVTLDGKKKTRLTPEAGTHSASFSAAFTYFVDSYSTIHTPARTVLRDAAGQVVAELESNATLITKLKGLKISKPEFFTFQTEEKVTLNGWMIKPADFDPAKKYPVLMHVYGGPGSQTVQDDYDPFNYIWHQMLAQEGCIVVSVDNRGTGARGRDFRTATYANLGHLETLDQISAAKYLQTLAYVDGQRIGIWGWSYGGYMTSLCMTKGKGIFKAGIAVAPVTNWRFYDTIYTERYLKTPQENEDGYDKNSPINFAKDLKGKYLLVHGTADDNVHVQNSYEMVEALVQANKQFDMFFYPNKNHGIYGGYTRYHLYRKMTDFLKENL